jgi:MoaA/NifB/PqqE/SkfB family radical SAM enzyme
MCNIWKTKSDDMTMEQIQSKITQLADFGIGYVFIQGGEPTLRKDLIEIVDAFLVYGIKPTVITNGILLKRELAEQIAERKCNLAISIDSLDRELFNKMRGVDKLDEVLENIEGIKNLIGVKKGNWSITTTVTKKTTIKDIKQIEEYANSRGFMFAIRPYIVTSGTAGKHEEDLSYKSGDVLSVFEYMLFRARKNNYLASLIYEEHIKYIRKENMPMCDAGKYSLLLQENGDISPCIEFPNFKLTLDRYTSSLSQYTERLCKCNHETPCFYNDAREVGFIWRKKWRIIINTHKIIKQIITDGNFF